MADRIHQNLTWSEWRRSVGAFATATAGAEPGEEISRLRAFHALVRRAPDGAPLDGILVPGMARFERLVDSHASESAAFAFVAPSTGCMISVGAEGFHLASISLPGRATEASASGATLALAVLAALAAAVSALVCAQHYAGISAPVPSRLLH